MNKHTEGPWRVGRPGSVVCDTPPVGRFKPFQRLAGYDDVEFYQGELLAESICNQADAILMAAAPEMLQALQTTLGNLKSLKSNAFKGFDTIDLWIAEVEAAIEKARGE